MLDLTQAALRDRTLAGMPDRMSRRPSLRPRLEGLCGRPASYRLLAVLWMAATAGFIEPLSAQKKHPATGRPEFRTVPQVGYDLRVIRGTLRDSDGLPEWGSDAYSLQWFRIDGDTVTEMSGVTGYVYRVVEADRGKKFRVTVSFKDAKKHSESRKTKKSMKTVSKEGSCSRNRRNADWCSRMWVWSANHRDNDGKYFGYYNIGSGFGVLEDRRIERGDSTLNVIGHMGIDDYKPGKGQDKVTVGLGIVRDLPDGTEFNIRGRKFKIDRGKTRNAGQYRWNRPSDFRLYRGQWIIVSATIPEATAYRNPNADALVLAHGLTPDDAAAALLGEWVPSEDLLAALDVLGNRNGNFDLGDLLSWIDRCRRGEADCGETSTESGPAGGTALPTAALGGAISGRAGGRAPGRREHRPVHGARRVRRRRSTAGYGLMMLLAATMTWSCADTDQVAAEPDPGFLTVELTGPTTNRDIGVALELEGHGIGAVRAPGLELYESSAPEQHQIVVAGSLPAGALLQFHVPDRNQLSLYRVQVRQVAGEDYQLRNVGHYQAVISN